MNTQGKRAQRISVELVHADTTTKLEEIDGKLFYSSKAKAALAAMIEVVKNVKLAIIYDDKKGARRLLNLNHPRISLSTNGNSDGSIKCTVAYTLSSNEVLNDDFPVRVNKFIRNITVVFEKEKEIPEPHEELEVRFIKLQTIAAHLLTLQQMDFSYNQIKSSLSWNRMLPGTTTEDDRVTALVMEDLRKLNENYVRLCKSISVNPVAHTELGNELWSVSCILNHVHYLTDHFITQLKDHI